MTEAPTLQYEYPLNERVRIYLRLEHLLVRLERLLTRTDTLDHHVAISLLFEIIEVGSRNDLRAEILKDLDKQKLNLMAYRNRDDIDTLSLETLIADFENAFTKLSGNMSKLGQALLQNDWLTSIRNRIHIPGGTCAFDLPGYFAWQNLPAKNRINDLQQWMSVFDDYAQGISLILHILRSSVVWQDARAQRGQFQLLLPADKGYQLAIISLPSDAPLYPVMSGTRLMLSIRLQALGTLPNQSNQSASANADATSALSDAYEFHVGLSA